MNMLNTYLETLQNKIFKLLPMREDYINGTDNHVYDYLNNLLTGFIGAIEQFPELKTCAKYIEVRNNLYFLRGKEVTLPRWRAVVLRSTRIVHELYSLNDKGVSKHG